MPRHSIGKATGNNKLKAMKIELNLKFEREITIKKEIYECDMKNEDLAFKLFSKQLVITKNKNKAGGQSISGVEAEVARLKDEIESTAAVKAKLSK